ncbi:Sialic acid TRAP transporter permease protein SiaT [subsurface metagenome]
MEVSPLIIGIIGWCVLLLLLFLEMPVGVALLLVSFGGIWCLRDLSSSLHIIARATYDTSITHLWSLIPLFVFMGMLTNEGGLGSDLFKTASKWLGGLRGGLAMTTTATSAAFSAVCGDNMAGAATMTSVCLPEMRKYKYDDSLSLATIAAGGILSFLIPPSLGFIIYGLLANVNISALFLGGVFPGIICALLYIAVIYTICRIDPAKGPAAPKSTWAERLLSLRYTWGVLLLVIIVFGGIYSGFITVTEAGALGAFAALVVGLIKGQLNWQKFRRAVLSSVQTTGMIFLLIIGAWAFAPFLSLTRIPATLVALMGDWSPWAILLFVLAFFFLGGMIFDAAILMIITIPLFLPLWMTAGFDLVWFGVVLMLIVIVSGITPPVGLVVYIVSGMVPGSSSGKVFRSALWFIPPVLLCAGLVIAFPQIATF